MTDATPTVTRGTSAVRLAVAMRAMEQAPSLNALVKAKDAAKTFLTPRDLDALRVAFDKAKARFR